LEEEEIYDPESADSPDPSDPDATRPSAPAAQQTKRTRESGGARSAMASRSAGWIVAAFLGGVVVTLSAAMIAWPSSATLVQSAANTSSQRAVASSNFVHVRGLRVIAGQAGIGCPAATFRSVGGVRGPVAVRVSKAGKRTVTVKGVPPLVVQRWVVVKGPGGQTTVRLIGPRVGLGRVYLNWVRVNVRAMKGKQVLLPGGRRVVIVRPGQAPFSINGVPGQGQAVIGPACQAQTVYLP
jgi:hypothetical protein